MVRAMSFSFGASFPPVFCLLLGLGLGSGGISHNVSGYFSAMERIRVCGGR